MFGHRGDELQDRGFSRAPLAVNADANGPVSWPGGGDAVNLARQRPTIQMIVLAPHSGRVKAVALRIGWIHLTCFASGTRTRPVSRSAIRPDFNTLSLARSAVVTSMCESSVSSRSTIACCSFGSGLATSSVFISPTLKCCCARPPWTRRTWSFPKDELTQSERNLGTISLPGREIIRSTQFAPLRWLGTTHVVPGYPVRTVTTSSV